MDYPNRYCAAVSVSKIIRSLAIGRLQKYHQKHQTVKTDIKFQSFLHLSTVILVEILVDIALIVLHSSRKQTFSGAVLFRSVHFA